MHDEELDVAIEQWRIAASYSKPDGLRIACENTAKALEIQKKTGIAVCSCCLKPLDGKCKHHVDAMY